MDKVEFEKLEAAVKLAISHVLEKGTDDIFKPPVFSSSLERRLISSFQSEFSKDARASAVKFIQRADLNSEKIGKIRQTLVVKDANTFRQVAWIDPFDLVKYLALTLLVFDKIEATRIPKSENIVHSHRRSDKHDAIFDAEFGYSSFRKGTGEIARASVGKWMVVTDISNFYDRIGNHSLENHLLDVGCAKEYVTLLREILLSWAGDRRSFGVPIGSDASRIISEAILIDIDNRLRENGIQFLRYVDDYRIVANSKPEAHRAIQMLTTLLAEEGLSINSGKTSIAEILDPEKVDLHYDVFEANEHEVIDEKEKKLVKVRKSVSGRTSYSKHYKQPGMDALKKIQLLKKDDLFSELEKVPTNQTESIIRLIVKFFVYADQDCEILNKLLKYRITTIFYLSDALIKEASRFDEEKRLEIVLNIRNTVMWKDFAYPFQLPVLRLFADVNFKEDSLARAIVDEHKLTDNPVFFREVLLLSYRSLDRQRIRKLVTEVFEMVPSFVGRAIYEIVLSHPSLSPDEKRPLLKNMKQSSDDWFINRMVQDTTPPPSPAAS